MLAEESAKAQSAAREYHVKATLLFNFTQFIEWPPAMLADTNAPFVIGILGADPFGKFLDELVKDERVHGKPIEIRRFRKPEETGGAHILFVSKAEQSKMGAILATMKDKPILTVGEEREVVRRGGGVAFVKERDNIRLCVNPEAVRSAGLTASAKLLRVAEIVQTEKQ